MTQDPNRPDSDIYDTVRELFPLPTRQTLEVEAAEMLPFGWFGISGGFGQTRRELVNAIQSGQPGATVEQIYHQLIVEGLRDQVSEWPDTFGGPCPHSLADLADDLADEMEAN
jgi:hypothetical protein